MVECLVVGIGGFIGSVCRYLIGLIPVREGWIFPVKTFLINIVGAFVIGMIAAATVKNSTLSPRLVLFLKVGVCAGNRRPDPERERETGAALCSAQYGRRSGSGFRRGGSNPMKGGAIRSILGGKIPFDPVRRSFRLCREDFSFRKILYT